MVQALGTSEIFDPAIGTFSSGPAMNVARRSQRDALRMVAYFLQGATLAAVQRFMIRHANSFSSGGGSLGTARSMHSAALMLDGRILIAGGRNGSGNPLWYG